jgi:hypothetical protein
MFSFAEIEKGGSIYVSQQLDPWEENHFLQHDRSRQPSRWEGARRALGGCMVRRIPYFHGSVDTASSNLTIFSSIGSTIADPVQPR